MSEENTTTNVVDTTNAADIESIDIDPKNNKYLFVINEDGTRATSYLLGLHGMTYDELRTKAQEAFPNCTYVEGTETEQQLFYKNYTHENGQMTAPPEPTAEEQKAKKQAELQSTYEADKEALMKYYLAASLAGDADTQNELRTELTNLDAQFDSDMKALNG